MNDSELDFQYRDIRAVLEKIEASTSRDEKILQQLFALEIPHYKSVSSFLHHIGLIKINKGNIELNISHSDLSNTRRLQKNIRERLISAPEPPPLLNHFLSHFDHLQYRPTMKDNLFFSNPRNLLMELGALEYDHETKTYTLDKAFLPLTKISNTDLSISPKKLEGILKQKSELGLKAEIAALAHEAERLKTVPKFAAQVKHIAVENVAAGYDILSYELNGQPRYIEVKAVSPTDYQFHWSLNEISVSETHGPKYFIYLIPVRSGHPDIKSIKIIEDAFHKIFLNLDWKKEPCDYIVGPSKNIEKVDQKLNS